VRVLVLGSVVALACVAGVACRRSPGQDGEAQPALASKSAAADADEAYKKGVALITPYLTMRRSDVKADPQAEANLHEGVRDFETAVKLDGSRADVLWALGQAQQALGDHESAYQALHRAYLFDGGKNADLPKELVLECLETGRGAEAVSVAQDAMRLHPEDSGMLANLALAYVIDGQVDVAIQTADRAVAVDPRDDVSATALQRILEVRAGKRPAPHVLGDLLN